MLTTSLVRITVTHDLFLYSFSNISYLKVQSFKTLHIQIVKALNMMYDARSSVPAAQQKTLHETM